MKAKRTDWRQSLWETSSAGGEVTPDRSHDEKNQLQFNPPVRVAGLSLSGYFDESSDMDTDGYFYSWGFIAEGAIDDVANKLKPYIKNVERLWRGKEEYARTEVRVGESSWLPINLPSGTVPMASTVERVFMLEPVDEKRRLCVLPVPCKVR